MADIQPFDEAARLNALHTYNILDTPQERDFDDLVKLAARICDTPVSLVSLVDRDRQWFKGRYGLNLTETPRNVSFCQYAIRQPSQILEVRDATVDPRFSQSELVRQGPEFRYYAGAPLVCPEGHALGTLCVLDTKPRHLIDSQKDALQILSRQVMAQLELRRKLSELHRASFELAHAHAEDHRRQEQLVAQRTAQINAQKEELQKRNQRLQLLNDASRRLLIGGSPDEMWLEIYEGIASHFRTSGFLEFSFNPSNQQLRLEMAHGTEQSSCKPGLLLNVGEGIAGAVARTGEPLVVNNIQASSEPRLNMIRGCGIRAYACYPLKVGNRLLGTFSFASNQRDEFSPEDRHFFETLVSNLALAKDRFRLLQQTENHARNLEHIVQERTARLSEMMAELRQMSYSMVHEMRAPLRAISAYAQLLEDEMADRLSGSTKQYFTNIQIAATRMDVLITGALNYNQILQENPNLEPVDVGRVLCDMVSTAKEFQLPRGQVALRGNFPKVLGSEGLLARCFYHLLQNALTYVPSGRAPKVEVWAEPTKGNVRLCFSDNGVGIPQEVQQRIFELFDRGDLDRGEGAGAGLALVRKAVERMRGRLWVESRCGKGSRFWLEFQAAE